LVLRWASELATVAKHIHMVCACDDVLTNTLGVKLQTADNVTLLRLMFIVWDGFC